MTKNPEELINLIKDNENLVAAANELYEDNALVEFITEHFQFISDYIDSLSIDELGKLISEMMMNYYFYDEYIVDNTLNQFKDQLSDDDVYNIKQYFKRQ